MGFPSGCFEVKVWEFVDGGGSVHLTANQLLDAPSWDHFEVHHLRLHDVVRA